MMNVTYDPDYWLRLPEWAGNRDYVVRLARRGECHIGMMDVEDCKRVVQACEERGKP